MESRNILLCIGKLILSLLIPILWTSPATSQFDQLANDYSYCPDRMSDTSKNEYCGSVDIPANHIQETEDRFSTPFRWLESQNPDAEYRPPVMWFNGGPGNSNLTKPPVANILSEFNVLLVGFRGIDSGPKLACEQIENALTQAHRILEDGTQAVGEAIRHCLDELTQIGYGAENFNVAQTVHDADYVRAKLGIERVHIVAGSFGTRLGLIYQEKFPDTVARSVFIGANPPGRTVWTPAAIDAVWQRVAKVCLDENRCEAEPAEQLTALRQRNSAEAKYLGIAFDEERARITSFLMAYDNAMLPYVADAYLDAYRGNQAGLFLLSVAHDFAVKSSGIYWGHFVLMAASSDFQVGQDYQALLAPNKTASFGSPLAALFWSELPGKHIPLVDKQYRELTHTPQETLLISGELDISAPLEQIVDEIVPFRPNAVHWIIPDSGHYNLYKGYIMTAVTDYLIDGEADQPSSVELLNLKPRLGLTEMLEIIMVAFVSLVAGIIFCITLYLRRRSH